MEKKFDFFLMNPKSEELESCVAEEAFDFPKTYFIAKSFFGKEKTLNRFKKELILAECKFLMDYVSLLDIEKKIIKKISSGNYVFLDEKEEDSEECWVINIEDIYFKSLNTAVDPHV